MRYAEACTLVALPSRYQASDGSWQDGDTVETEVFCNSYTVSLEEWSVSNRDLGLRADAELQLRTVDYDGQPTVIYNGAEYTVERVTVSGEFTRLQLGKLVPNV